jgi:predicted MPP superfamily phosphohydrolase
MEELRRWAPNAVVILCALGLHWYILKRLQERTAKPWLRVVLWAGFCAATAWMMLVVPYLMSHRARALSAQSIGYLIAGSLFWVLVVISVAVWLRWAQPAVFDPGRRHLLALAAPLAGVPLISAGAGVVVARTGMGVVETELKVPGLPRDLDGLRIIQLTDIHFGPFFGKAELRRAVAMANEARPHLTVLTGDLITRRGDDVAGCLRELKALRAEAGVYGCHGNHEYYAGTLKETTRRGQEMGFRFLRGEAEVLTFGSARLNLAGHDYQRRGVEYLPGARKLVRPDSFNLLLQHNPDVFPRAVEEGFEVTLAGHTHGGQINVEILEENLNVARFFTPYVKGRYEMGGGQLYVSSGLGTVGVPVRLGAAPEITLIKLCAV